MTRIYNENLVIIIFSKTMLGEIFVQNMENGRINMNLSMKLRIFMKIYKMSFIAIYRTHYFNLLKSFGMRMKK